MPDSVQATFFRAPVEWRAWLARHHDEAPELWVGFYKKASGKPSMTWPESVDEALCFGWIDGVRKSLGQDSYMIRFSPRKPGSMWSAVNIKRAGELANLGRMRPAGMTAFGGRKEGKSRVYSYEQKQDPQLSGEYEEQFRANPRAWEFFVAQAASYKRAAIWWFVSAKREETRAKRLAALIDDSAQGRTLAHLTRKPRASRGSGGEEQGPV